MTLAVALVGVILAVQVVGAVWLAFAARDDGRSASGDVAQIVADAYAERAATLARPSSVTATDVADAVADGALGTDDMDGLVSTLHGYLVAQPPFQTLAVFTPDGAAVALLRTKDGLRLETLAPDGTATAQLVDDALNPVETLTDPPIPSEPPVWLVDALAAVGEGPTWHDVQHESTGTHQAVVTVAVPAGDAMALAAVGIPAAALNASLDDGSAGAAASAFLLDADGVVIAGPTDTVEFERPEYAAVDGGRVGFIDGQVVFERPLSEELGPEWTVHVQVVPDEIVPAIASFPRQMIMYTVAVAVLVAIVGVVLWAMRRPLLQTVVRARTDQLTGLANRYELNRRGQTMLDAASKRPADIAVVVIDLDHFKSVNDEMGHDAGDMVLRACGSALTLHSGDRDLVARLGGDEFAVVRWLELGADPDAIVEELRGLVERDIRALVPSASRVGVSAGFTTAALAGSYKIGELITAADEALMGGRRDGKGRTFAAPATNPMLV